ncbi:SDR family oxidoreductase [Carnimonas bestiolae]|uniref:SDR family oxidoreductase n=1 Tax=Carnimonas bestiolae TaxID=3402172 RepID=UPI003EDC2ADB
MGRFKNKTLLITGGSSGIGLVGARRIVAEGGKVIVTGLNRARLQAAEKELGGSATVIYNDASDPDASAALAEQVKAHAPLDGLWLNAASASLAMPEEVDADSFDALMATNVKGPVLQMAKLSSMLTPGASVLLTASSSAYEKATATGLYGATKGAIIALTRSWAAAFAPRGIRVNTLVPGPIETNFRDFLSDEAKRGFETFVVSQVPLRRPGTADEAAAVALFLLSDDASYVTGSQYAVDGGLIMH